MGRQKQKTTIEISREEAIEFNDLVKNSKLGIHLKELIQKLKEFEGESQITIINKNLTPLNKSKSTEAYGTER